MAHAPNSRLGSRGARTIRPTARRSLAAALCVLALPAGSGWSQHAHLFASDAQPIDWFGQSIAVSGDTIVVGTPRDKTAAGARAGSAYVFTTAGGTWRQQHHLFADDAVADDRFGRSASINGDTIAIGAIFDDTAGSNAGSAYVFGPPYLMIFKGEPESPNNN